MKQFYILLFCLSSYGSFAQPFKGEIIQSNVEERSSGCTPPNASTYLELNNVSALIHTAGNLWQIAGQNRSHYEVPKGSGIMALFTSSLWLGGVDINGQLKLAALRYRNGQDYWTGPLTTAGDAEIIPETCLTYDKHFKITKEEVLQFNAWYTAGLEDAENGTSTQSENFPEYEIPKSILEWPAHGDVTLGQPEYIAPFYDRNADGQYNPLIDGDYPHYDIEREIDCRNSREVTLFGDETLWWIMNDKGNIHTETYGEPLGMEIRAQAFAFATNNEINNMTFYNYELINRSTQTLYETYFGILVDVALGGPNDDYVGCDVSRGLGYAYNGDNFDESESGYKGYGDQPPAVGVDFFEGPYQDNDNFDNPLTEDVQSAFLQDGIPYSGLGIGYGDSIIDNERFGMRRFLYYNNLGGGGDVAQTDPQVATDYYAYLRGFWKDGSRFVYGGNGHPSDPDANANVFADFMFPGDTDPLGWGTGGTIQPTWTEETSNNVPFDRRFAQSAGPFILRPGAVNNITLGVVWAQSTSGGPFESVKQLFAADDKAQALFDNCFNVLEGPYAPDLQIQELENSLIITLHNPNASNNANEDYIEFDPEIVSPDSIEVDRYYRFQGYQVYQIKSKDVSANNLDDITKARLVFQCDVEDDVSKLINYTFDSEINASVPTVEVNGENKGIRHSFMVTEDLFANGDRTLVNFKKYYYMAIAYAYNDYQTYTPDDPASINGQKKPYLSSRKATFGEIKPYLAIPHHPAVEGNGTSYGTYYGWSPIIRQVEGIGNGNRTLGLTERCIADILANGEVKVPEYDHGLGPIDVKVIDPLNLKPGDYEIIFEKEIEEKVGGLVDSCEWVITRTFEGITESLNSDFPIGTYNEQLFPEWGISVTIKQSEYTPDPETVQASGYFTPPIGATISYSDSSKIWLTGVEDSDQNYPTNWIRVGSNIPPMDPDPSCSDNLWINNPCFYYDRSPILDPGQKWESLLSGTITAFKYLGFESFGMPLGSPASVAGGGNGYFNVSSAIGAYRIQTMHDVDIVLTNDKDFWTRCVVIEMNDNENQTVGESDVLEIRNQASVDKDGDPIEGETGMGWFPGYAINVNTGQRLNMIFGENSWLAGENGNDMIWNPSSNLVSSTNEPLLGGMHYVYVLNAVNGMPIYDKGKYAYENLSLKTNTGHKNVFGSCTWVWEPMLEPFHEVLESDVTIQARVNKPYTEYPETQSTNQGRPRYEFTISAEDMVRFEQTDVLKSLLDIINIVPNPYYAYSEYEQTRLDNRVKFTNLPQKCNITIFSMAGQLIKQIEKDNEITSLDWDITNMKGVPITSGVYIIHVEVPGVGEKVLKWFCVMRTQDFNNL